MSVGSLLKNLLSFVILVGLIPIPVLSETILLLGGEVNDLLHPSITSVEAFGACGTFDAGIPDLSTARKDFAAALYEDKIVVCGGHAYFADQKDCSFFSLGTPASRWEEFPSLLLPRKNFGLVTVGGNLFALGGDQSIEMFNGSEWEEFGESTGTRLDFCALPWGDDGIMVTGGFINSGEKNTAEMLNVTTRTWTSLADLKEGRDLHACTPYKGGVAVAGGWAEGNNPNYPEYQAVTRTAEWYNPETDTWSDLGLLVNARSKFALQTVNGTLTALGGWQGLYTESIEQLNSEDGVWDWYDQHMSQQKAAFGVVKVPNELLKDASCYRPIST